MNPLSRLLWGLVLAFYWLGCGGPAAEPTGTAPSEVTAPISVFAVNYPLAYLAERLGGEHVEVTLPVPPDLDPAGWSPSPEVVGTYQGADLILLNGAGYAKWVSRVSLPEASLVDTSRSFRDKLLPLAGAVTHTHGPGGEHAHSGWAFTTWLDPQLAIEHARKIATALEAERPADSAHFREHLAEVEADLSSLDQRLRNATQTLAGRPVLFSHPVYQYLIHRYGLNARSVHWEAGEMPTEPMWRALETTLTEHPARLMIWEAPPSPEISDRLEALGVRSVVYDPCANRPAEGDLMSVMERNLTVLEEITPQAAR